MFIYMSLLKTLGVLFANSTLRLLVKKKKKSEKIWTNLFNYQWVQATQYGLYN